MITRWLESLLREGRAPDPRFTLALERALRRGEPLPPAPLVPVFAVALGLTAVLLLVVVAVRP